MPYQPENATDEEIAALFGDTLAIEKHTAEVLDRLTKIMQPEIDLRNLNGKPDIRYELHGTFRGKQQWTAWDANAYDGPESALGSGE